ncbi:hypothetical protein DU500_10560 [Haloplanus rubicundus]|uniref:Uncharacterized protein n=1 Tax=Haloplanus rubicundus TaxID=1547898 RepID=A0A345E3R3_9EURY|nr:hypothetical protein [Haloplanus rubicundus]AXG06835.1 hypothetical protein DU500_10560 [Haloplanus rubicundus]
MANDPGPDIPVTVSTGEVRVGKAFEADRFPVPAIAFEIESLADEPIRVRLVDDIPESFPMEGVGFHPDYEGDNWTAYRDNRVAYERTLEPGESVLTVYGIRIDDPGEADDFLGDPEIELIEHGDAAATGDVLGRETTQVVRDALSGDESGDDLSGLESEPLLDDEAPTPRERADDPTVVTGDRDGSVTAVDVEAADGEAVDADADEEETDADDADEEETDDTVPSAEAAEALDPRDDEATVREPTADADAEAADDDATADAPAAAAGSSIAAALAAEIRAGTVDDDDLTVLREAFEADAEGGVPTSVDVRIGRLQSQIEDLLAYRDALADFLDENGTAEEVVGEVNEALADLTERVEALDDAVVDADDERAALADDVATVTDRVDDVADRLETVAADLDDLSATAERIEERLDAVDDLESDVEDIEAELDDLRDFRDRLNSAFGTDE